MSWIIYSATLLLASILAVVLCLLGNNHGLMAFSLFVCALAVLLLIISLRAWRQNKPERDWQRIRRRAFVRRP